MIADFELRFVERNNILTLQFRKREATTMGGPDFTVVDRPWTEWKDVPIGEEKPGRLSLLSLPPMLRSLNGLRDMMQTIEKETRSPGGRWSRADVNDAAKMALSLYGESK